MVNRRAYQCLATLCGAAILIAACDTDVAAPPDGQPLFSMETAPGVRVDVVDMDTRLTRLARAVARVLGSNQALRNQVAEGFARSPFPEQKLEFKALLGGQQVAMLHATAAEYGTTPAGLRSALDSIVPLELYMPVSAHRESWTGEDDAIVVSLFSDDGGFDISAFDLEGNPYSVEAGRIPERPSIALVPAEYDFARGRMSTAIGGESSYSGGDGLYMVLSRQPDLHEPFPLGSPEIVVHTAVYNSSADTVEWKACAGDGSSGAFYFDQNDTIWADTVKIADKSVVQNNEFEIFVWEDDWQRCDGSNNLTPHQDAGFLNNIKTSTVKAGYEAWEEIKVIFDGDTTWVARFKSSVALLGSAYELAGAATHDDLIGVTERLSTQGGCFPEASGPVTYFLRDENEAVTGARIEIDDNFSERVLCELEAWIQGPTQLLSCPGGFTPPDDYVAQYQFGEGTPSFKWWEDGTLRGTSSTYNILNGSVGQRQLILQVTRSSETVRDTAYVTIAAPNEPEEECEAQ
jgi:hypothetical protein